MAKRYINELGLIFYKTDLIRSQNFSNPYNSAVVPVISVILTGSYFMILTIFNIINFKAEMMALIIITMVKMIIILPKFKKKKN